MTKAEETVLERIMHYQQEAAVALDAVEDKETLKSELDQIFSFLRKYELRIGDKNCSHINYGGIAKTWYSALSGRYLFDTDALPTLNNAIVKTARIGVPLQLVECREDRLELFPLHFDIDIKIQADENGVLKYTFSEIENEIIDEESGFRFFKIFAKIINIVYPTVGDMVVYSASGENRLSTPVDQSGIPSSLVSSKVSFRVVFPTIVVNRQRAHKVWVHVVQKLQDLSREDTNIPFIRQLQKRLKQLSPANGFERVIDETVLKCRNGVRMIFNDKIERGQTAGRIFKSLFVLSPEMGTDAKITQLNVSRRPTGEEADDLDFLRMGSLVTPSLSHAVLSEWNQPATRNTSRVTKTGAGGSSLALINLTTADAARAANRAGTTRRKGWNTNQNFGTESTPLSAEYSWSSGSCSEFKKRMPVGIEAQFEQSLDGTVTWRITKRRNNWISYSDSTKSIQLMAPDSDTLRQITGIVQRFPNIEAIASTATIPAPQVAPPTVRRERVFRVKQTFKGQEEGELDIEAGETVILISDDPTGWTGVKRVRDGHQGFVPRVYLDQL